MHQPEEQHYELILRSPLGSSSITRTAFETILLEAWSYDDDRAQHCTPDGVALTADRRARIAAIKDQWKQEPAAAFELQAAIFNELPGPVLLHSEGRYLGNNAFKRVIIAERELSHKLPIFDREPTLKRFDHLLNHGRKINATHVLLPLGGRTWNVRVVWFDDLRAGAIYLSSSSICLGDLPLRDQLVILYTLTGLTIEQTAWLTDLTPHQVNYRIRKNRDQITKIRGQLCPEPIR